jgi:hypothetical protein
MIFILLIAFGLFLSLFVAHLASQLADRMLTRDPKTHVDRDRCARDQRYARVLQGMPR